LCAWRAFKRPYAQGECANTVFVAVFMRAPLRPKNPIDADASPGYVRLQCESVEGRCLLQAHWSNAPLIYLFKDSRLRFGSRGHAFIRGHRIGPCQFRSGPGARQWRLSTGIRGTADAQWASVDHRRRGRANAPHATPMAEWRAQQCRCVGVEALIVSLVSFF